MPYVIGAVAGVLVTLFWYVVHPLIVAVLQFTLSIIN